MTHRRVARLASGLILAVLGCTEPGIQRENCFLPVPDVPEDGCTASDEKLYVDGVMRRHYLFNDQLPALDRAEFETADDLLRALLADITPRDRFSYLTTQSGEARFYEEGKVLGLGFNTRWVGEALVLAQVYGSQDGEPPSPASSAGLRRGDRILAIGGRTVEELAEAGEVGAAFGPNEPGLEVELRVASPGEEPRDLVLTRAFFVFDPVPVAKVIERDGRRIGYLMLRSFVEPAVSEMSAAFGTFRRAPIDDLILDLRYNSGGLIQVARALARFIVGRPHDGGVLWQREFNQDNAACLETDYLRPLGNSLNDVDRVVALTLGGTASASEQTISGLQPYVPTRNVGGTTYGKPFGQLGFAFCADRVLRPVTFRTVNADGDGSYVEGMAPDCEVSEAVDGEFGDPEEAMLSAALEFLATGRCDAAKSAPKTKVARPERDRTLRVPGRPPGAELIF